MKTIDQYLARSPTTPSLKLEPFVLGNKRANSFLTICAWLPDTDLHLLAKWATNWTDPISVLMTTTVTPASSSHATLLKTLQKSISIKMAQSLSVHILHLGKNEPESPNLYLNLARLFALTEWTLVFPDDLRTPVLQVADDSVFFVQHQRDTGIYVLSLGNTDSYPFPALSPLLLRRNQDFWCTERIFLRTSRASDWSECLWQASLEMIGKIQILRSSVKEQTSKNEEIPSESSKGVVNQRLSARFRGEMCDMFLKQVTLIHPRGRYKEMSLDWVKSFCTKVRCSMSL
ncbi:hypothetical protein BDN70DRAFT_973634 [Pholiota conissans]|uniref:Uncharacterized protein n=1 Tax=Pholiota conissans TaxID=109636 RepID=A0A9P5Z7E0_9AGAR|nr:hypothetical protein BDN70DRAFT_973634 [Pholiota conissans]